MEFPAALHCVKPSTNQRVVLKFSGAWRNSLSPGCPCRRPRAFYSSFCRHGTRTEFPTPIQLEVGGRSHSGWPGGGFVVVAVTTCEDRVVAVFQHTSRLGRFFFLGYGVP